MRKSMGRAMRHGKKVGIGQRFLHELVRTVADRMGGAYPELLAHADTVARVVLAEEERFGSTLRQAMAVFEQVAERHRGARTIPGAEAFRLYDTYGLPLDFTEELASDRGLGVDVEGFERELKAQQDRARQSSRMGAVAGDPVYVRLLEEGRTDFRGYDTLVVDDARVLAVLKDGQPARRLDAGQAGLVILDRTPFYAASGGQVGDHGVLSS